MSATDINVTRTDNRSGLKLALLAFSMLIIAIDFNIVYVALPSIGDQLGFTPQTLQWVVSAYAVTWGGFLLLGGRAVDRLGPRRMFLCALGVYAVSSLIGGFASDAGLLVGARALQGVGAALLFPATLALIHLNFEEGPARNRAMAAWGGAASSGLIVGSTIGGLLTAAFGWPWVFFINVPLAIIGIVAGLRLLPADAAVGQRGGFDLLGGLLATAGSSLVVFGLVSGPDAGWASLRGGGAIAAGALLLLLFVLSERRDADVLMPLRLFGHRNLRAAIVMVILFMTAINILHYVFFIQLQNVLGFNAFQAGLAFAPVTVGGLLGSMKALPWLLNKYGIRMTLFVGILGIGLSMLGFAPTVSLSSTYWMMLPSTFVWGFSAGIAFSAVFLAAGSGVAPSEQGVASSMASTAQQVGGAMGLAVLVAIANAGLSDAPALADTVDGLRTAIWVGAGIAIVGAFLAFTSSESAPAPSADGPASAN